MTRLHELKFAEIARVEQLFHEQIFARINDRLHHHVVEAGLLRECDDLFAVFNARRHRHGAGDVFARLQRGDTQPCVIGDRRIDMHRVHVWVFEQRLEIGVTLRHAKVITDGVELLRIALTDGVAIRVGMFLPEWNELRAEAEADDCDVKFLAHGEFELIVCQMTRRDDDATPMLEQSQDV